MVWEAVPGMLQMLSCISLFSCLPLMLWLSPGNLESLSASSMNAQYCPSQHVKGQSFSTVQMMSWCYRSIWGMTPMRCPARTSPTGTLLLFFRVCLPEHRLSCSTISVPSAKFKMLDISKTLLYLQPQSMMHLTSFQLFINPAWWLGHNAGGGGKAVLSTSQPCCCMPTPGATGLTAACLAALVGNSEPLSLQCQHTSRPRGHRQNLQEYWLEEVWWVVRRSLAVVAGYLWVFTFWINGNLPTLSFGPCGPI